MKSLRIIYFVITLITIFCFFPVEQALSVNRCKAKISKVDGTILVKAKNISGELLWGVKEGEEDRTFSNASTCIDGKRAIKCELAAEGSEDRITPPQLCNIFLKDNTSTCLAYVKGCTPGKREIDITEINEITTDLLNESIASLSGVWHYSEGPLFESSGFVPEFIVLNQDGTGRMNLQTPQTKVLACGSFVYSRGMTPTLTIDLSGFSIGNGVQVFPYELEGENTLRLTDHTGEMTTFNRVEEVDPAFECGIVSKDSQFDNLPEPDGFTGLAYDGTSLWYEENNTRMIYPVNPLTGATGAPVSLSGSQFSHVHAMQGDNFWAHCGCGGSQEAQRRTMADMEVDEVDTGTDLGDEISIRGIAYDETGNVLWLQGFSFDEGIRKLLKVNSNLEPDVLISSVELNISLSSMAWDGTHLWGLASSFPQVIVKINPNTAQSIGTFSIPDTSVQWYGIASVSTQLFLIGRNSTNDGVLIGVTPQ